MYQGDRQTHIFIVVFVVVVVEGGDQNGIVLERGMRMRIGLEASVGMGTAIAED
jgi:hypothetical protein